MKKEMDGKPQTRNGMSCVFFCLCLMGVFKNRGNTPKMDGLFHGKPY